MASKYLTMLDLARRRGSDAVVGLIEENQSQAPEYNTIPVRPITGTSFLATTRVGLPAVQFRKVNEGVPTSKSEYAQKLTQAFFLDSQLEVDTAIIEADEMGLGTAGILSDEASGVMLALMLLVGKQFYYGQSNDANGFQGLVNFVDTSMVVNAGGTTASTGSSVFAVKVGHKFLEFIAGRNSSMQMGKWRVQQISRPDPITAEQKKLTAMVNNLQGWLGLSIGHVKSVGQIYNLTNDSGKGWTDALTAALLQKFPAGMRPDFLFATPRSIGQLQTARSALGQVAYGGGAIAPYPTESMGVPIVPTDSILNTEAIA
jgi:hypothetical protein